METRKKQLETLKVTHLFITHFWSKNFNLATSTIIHRREYFASTFLETAFHPLASFFLTLRVTNFDFKHLHYFNDRVVLSIFLP